jgi:hypothetical protein
MQAANFSGWKSRAARGFLWIWRGSLVTFFTWVAASVAWVSLRSEDFPASLLEPDPGSLDLGAHWPQTDLIIPLTIRNQGSRSLVVRDFEASPPVRPSPPLPRNIPAGHSSTFSLHVDLAQLLAADRPAGTDSWNQPFALMVRPITNWGRAPLPWRIRGVARLPVRGLPATLSLGSNLMTGIVPEPRDVDLEVHSEVERLEVSSESPLVRAELLRRQEPPETGGRPYTLRVIPQPSMTARPGPFRVLLRTTAVAADGTQVVGPDLVVAGGVVRDLQLVPSQLMVTYRHAGETHKHWLAIHSRTGRDFDLVGWDLPDEDVRLTVDPVSRPDLPPDSDQADSRSFQLSFQIRGTPSGSMSPIRLRLRYRDSEAIDEYELPVRWVQGSFGDDP